MAPTKWAAPEIKRESGGGVNQSAQKKNQATLVILGLLDPTFMKVSFGFLLSSCSPSTSSTRLFLNCLNGCYSWAQNWDPRHSAYGSYASSLPAFLATLGACARCQLWTDWSDAQKQRQSSATLQWHTPNCHQLPMSDLPSDLADLGSRSNNERQQGFKGGTGGQSPS